MFSAREKESCYFTLTRSLIKIIYKDLLIFSLSVFLFSLKFLCLPCPSKRGFILDSNKFHQGVISEVPLKTNAWQQDDQYVHIIARELQERGAKPSETWDSLPLIGKERSSVETREGPAGNCETEKHSIKTQRPMLYGPLGIDASVIKQQSNVRCAIWEVVLLVSLQATSSKFRAMIALNRETSVAAAQSCLTL